jgi:hypothetical protein
MIEIQTGHVRFIPRTLEFATKNRPEIQRRKNNPSHIE